MKNIRLTCRARAVRAEAEPSPSHGAPASVVRSSTMPITAVTSSASGALGAMAARGVTGLGCPATASHGPSRQTWVPSPSGHTEWIPAARSLRHGHALERQSRRYCKALLAGPAAPERRLRLTEAAAIHARAPVASQRAHETPSASQIPVNWQGTWSAAAKSTLDRRSRGRHGLRCSHSESRGALGTGRQTGAASASRTKTRWTGAKRAGLSRPLFAARDSNATLL
jgi:hypothetical protein